MESVEKSKSQDYEKHVIDLLQKKVDFLEDDLLRERQSRLEVQEASDIAIAKVVSSLNF